MTIEDLANVDGDKSTTPAPAADKAETPADGADKAPEAGTEEGKEPKTEKTEEQLAAEASEAAKKLNERKQTARERVQQAVNRQRQAERERDAYRQEATELRAKLKEPRADDYTDPAKLTADQVKHTLDSSEAERLDRRSKEADQQVSSAAQEAWTERTLDFKVDHPDFEDVAYRAPISKETSSLVFSVEDGPAIAYWLGKNPAEARRIDRLSERDKLVEFGRIVAQQSAPPVRRQSQAPEPINPVAGKTSGNNPNPEKMSQADFEKWWNRKK